VLARKASFLILGGIIHSCTGIPAPLPAAAVTYRPQRGPPCPP
jgi:hypothetical protein